MHETITLLYNIGFLLSTLWSLEEKILIFTFFSKTGHSHGAMAMSLGQSE